MKNIERYEGFHWGRRVDKTLRVERPSARGQLIALGECTAISYLADKNEGELVEYVHEFEAPLPLLVADETDTLFLVGGAYAVTKHGIEG